MRVGLVGAGNMARAMARGWGDAVVCSDSGSGRAQKLVDELGGDVVTNAELADRADLIVLCHKPYQLRDVALQIGDTAKPVVSVLGGITTRDIQHAFTRSQVFVLIPNTPVEVRRGVIVYEERDPSLRQGEGSSPALDEVVEAQVLERFRRLGTVVTLPERLMRAANAITGVGPAYQALLAEAQIDAAVRHGVGADLASRLVVETMAGTAELISLRDYDTLAVRREVTSPGGSTARGLDALERSRIRTAFQNAIDAVVQRKGPNAAVSR
jgi:pyrroline-5-carboxylate reductase